MKKFLLLVAGALTGMVSFGQNFTITGTVLNTSGNPMPNHQIYISADSSVFNYYNTVYTDVNGNYSDIIPNGAQTGPNIDFFVWTYDYCYPNGNWQQVTLSNMQGTVTSGVADFTVCDSTQSSNCAASFYAYSPNNSTTWSFYDASYGSGLSYSWDFGDGNTSTLANPMHSYATPGNYTVCLTISSFLCSDTYCQTISVANGPACQASFYAQNDTVNNVVYLYDLSYYSGSSVTYFWDFGDGNTSTLQYPTHTYANYGIYSVCLTIADNSSCTSTYCDSVGYFQFAGGGSRSGFTINVVQPSQLGVNENENLITELNLYPNPSTENVALEYTVAVAGNHTLTLVDITGKLIFTETFAAQKGANRKTIDVQSYDSGVYMLIIADENGKQNHLPLIKE